MEEDVRKPLPIEIVLRDLAMWAERTPQPYLAWAEGVRAEIEQLRELLWRWMSTQEGDEPVTPELLEETDAALAATEKEPKP